MKLLLWQNEWTQKMLFETGYGQDGNGNIKTMRRTKSNGMFFPSIYDQIDDLVYTYEGNQLMAVRENAIMNKDYTAGATDFRVRNGNSTPAIQYEYDENGNMVKDHNKGITIAYNYLNLPSSISFLGGNQIVFTYNAAGEKVSQSNINSYGTAEKETHYVNGFLYEKEADEFGTVTLKSFGLPHGRMVNVRQANGTHALQYEYHYTDHLGNLRLAFRVKNETINYALTAEQENLEQETETFSNYTKVVRYRKNKYLESDPYVYAGNYSVKLTGDGAEVNSFVSKQIHLKAGETIKMKVWAKVAPQPPTGGVANPNSKTSLAANFVNNSSLLTITDNKVGDKSSPSLVVNPLAALPLLKKLWKPKNSQSAVVVTEDEIAIDAGLQIKLLEYATPPGLVSQVGINIDEWQFCSVTYTAEEEVYISAEIFNNTGNVTYFDNWEIEITKPAGVEIVQETHYDPWGLVMSEECFSSGDNTEFMFNGKEYETFADLNFYDYHWRQYDPQLGRWHSPDPADQFYGISGYAYCANNPVMLNDPDGRWIHIAIGAVVGGLVNLGIKAYQGQINSVGDGLAAFGIGAVAGGLGAATGGASLAATGSGFGGVLLAGAAGSAVASPIQGIGNMAYFGDPYSLEQWGTDIVMGAAAAGVGYGIGKGFSKLFPKTTETVSKAAQNIQNKVNQWFRNKGGAIRRYFGGGNRQGNFEIGDLTFEQVDDVVEGASQQSLAGVQSGQVVATGQIVNLRGVAYPQVTINGYGVVPFPQGPYTPNNSAVLRSAFSSSYKAQFRAWWEAQGRQWPTPSQGSRIDIHHIKPLKWGGTNNFENLVPLDYNTQHRFFTSWWRNFN